MDFTQNNRFAVALAFSAATHVGACIALCRNGEDLTELKSGTPAHLQVRIVNAAPPSPAKKPLPRLKIMTLAADRTPKNHSWSLPLPSEETAATNAIPEPVKAVFMAHARAWSEKVPSFVKANLGKDLERRTLDFVMQEGSAQQLEEETRVYACPGRNLQYPI